LSTHEDRPKPPETAARVKRSAAQQRETERARAFDAVEATFPSPSTATPDELVQMAIHALGFDSASLAASLGISRAEGDRLMRSPGTVLRRHRALLAQYLEMRGDAGTAARNQSIAARLREIGAQEVAPPETKLGLPGTDL
jgi:kynurenine formamidase